MSLKKSHTKIIKLQIPAGKALPTPPVGPALGVVGINIMAFCKAFNERTRSMGDVLVTVVIYADLKKKDFKFEVKQPPISFLIKKAAGIEKGSKTPNREKGAQITVAQLREVAEKKMEDLFANTIEAALRTAIGSAKSMGLEIIE